MKQRSLAFLLSTVIALVALGLVTLGSIGSYATGDQEDPYGLVRKQLLWAGIGLILAIAGVVINYHYWQRVWLWALGSCVLLLALCWAPGVGVELLGAHRWIRLPGLGFFQ